MSPVRRRPTRPRPTAPSFPCVSPGPRVRDAPRPRATRSADHHAASVSPQTPRNATWGPRGVQDVARYAPRRPFAHGSRSAQLRSSAHHFPVSAIRGSYKALNPNLVCSSAQMGVATAQAPHPESAQLGRYHSRKPIPVKPRMVLPCSVNSVSLAPRWRMPSYSFLLDTGHLSPAPSHHSW